MGRIGTQKGKKKATPPYTSFATNKDTAMATLFNMLKKDPTALQALITVTSGLEPSPNIPNDEFDDDDDDVDDNDDPEEIPHHNQDDHTPSEQRSLHQLESQLKSARDRLTDINIHIERHEKFMSDLEPTYVPVAKANLQEQIALKNTLIQSIGDYQSRILAARANASATAGKSAKSKKDSRKPKQSEDEMDTHDPDRSAYFEKIRLLALLSSGGNDLQPSGIEQTVAQISEKSSRLHPPPPKASTTRNPWNVFAGLPDPTSSSPSALLKNPPLPPHETLRMKLPKLIIKKPRVSSSSLSNSGVAASVASSSKEFRRTTKNSQKAAAAAAPFAADTNDSFIPIITTDNQSTPSTITTGELVALTEASDAPESPAESIE